MLAIFREHLASELADIEFMDGDSATGLDACGESLVRTCMDQGAPSIESAAVELHGSPVRSSANCEGW